jgi:ATP-dependent protease Clp ATPase subunit
MPGIRRGLKCSFCGKRDSEVAKLVAGAHVSIRGRAYICDVCVAIASRIMADAGDPVPSRKRSPGTTA